MEGGQRHVTRGRLTTYALRKQPRSCNSLQLENADDVQLCTGHTWLLGQQVLGGPGLQHFRASATKRRTTVPHGSRTAPEMESTVRRATGWTPPDTLFLHSGLL
ncbi:hypothetical protein GN956_G18268 [Arapaima gigas]